MPCYDPGAGYEILYNDIDKLTKLLCEACGLLERNNLFQHTSVGLGIWWDSHKRWHEQSGETYE